MRRLQGDNMFGEYSALARHHVVRLFAVAAAAAVLVAGTAPLFAKPPPDETLPSLPQLPTSLQQARPTKFDPLERSLEELLNDGFAIVGFSALAVGPGVVLQQDGRRWVFCALLLATQPGRPAKAASKCWALN